MYVFMLYLGSKLLQSSYVDGTLLCSVEVTPAHAEVTSRTHHSTGESQGVVRENGTGSSVIVL